MRRTYCDLQNRLGDAMTNSTTTTPLKTPPDVSTENTESVADATSTEPRTVPAQFLVLENFLTTEEREAFLSHVLDQAEFTPASVYAPGAYEGHQDPSARSALTADGQAPVFGLIDEKLRAVLPHARRESGVPYFAEGLLERQVTVHRDGHFFGPHTDTGDSWNMSASRRLTASGNRPGQFRSGNGFDIARLPVSGSTGTLSR